MTKIGICDDNITLLRKYQNMIEDICGKGMFEDVEIQSFHDGSKVLIEAQNNKEFVDILFLDILMDELNGVETARQLKKMRSKAIIIFLTSSEEYIFDSMDVKPLAYLMKDQVSETSLMRVLQEAKEKVQKEQKAIHFDKDGGQYRLSYSDICFIKVYKKFCYIHHWDGIIFESKDLSLLDGLDMDFFRVHEQYIINLQYLGTIEKDRVVLSDESSNVIPLSSQYEHALKVRFAEYMIERM